MAGAVAVGTVHKLPTDLRKALVSEPKILAQWENIAPLARNEWICWVTSAKLDETRKRRITVGLDKMRKACAGPVAGLVALIVENAQASTVTQLFRG